MVNFKVCVTRGFSAAHALRGYKGKCEKLHGHNWKVKISLAAGRLNKTGMAIDFTDMKCVLDGILAKLDHGYLNETAPFNRINPTAENIAAHILNELIKKTPKGVKVSEVEVWESDTSSATAVNQ